MIKTIILTWTQWYIILTRSEIRAKWLLLTITLILILISSSANFVGDLVKIF